MEVVAQGEEDLHLGQDWGLDSGGRVTSRGVSLDRVWPAQRKLSLETSRVLEPPDAWMYTWPGGQEEGMWDWGHRLGIFYVRQDGLKCCDISIGDLLKRKKLNLIISDLFDLFSLCASDKRPENFLNIPG